MEWIWNATLAYIGWNVIGPAIIGFAILLAAAIASLPRLLRQMRCKHIEYFETRACDAICCACGANLGFIGTVRDQCAKERV